MQNPRLDGFGQVVVEARLLRAPSVFRLSPAAHGDQQHGVAELGANPSSSLVTVQFGKADIQDDDLRPKLRRRLHGRQAVVRHPDLVSPLAEQQFQALRGIQIVIDDEHATSLRGGQGSVSASGGRLRFG